MNLSLERRQLVEISVCLIAFALTKRTIKRKKTKVKFVYVQE